MADGLFQKSQLSTFWCLGTVGKLYSGLFLRTTSGGCWAVAPGGSRAGRMPFWFLSQQGPAPVSLAVKIV